MQTARRFSRSKDYTGQYRGAVRPATWQENMVSLLAGLAAAQRSGSTLQVGICEKAIAAHQAKDAEAYNRKFGLIK